MRTETFYEDHEVNLSEEERNLRGRQAARLSLSIKAHKARAEEEEEAWKLRKKQLKTDEEKLVETLYQVGKAAETGKETRPVACKEVLRGVMVETIREDTGETVGARSATKDELREHEPPPMVPGGGAKGATKKASPADDGIVPDDYRPQTH